MDTHRKKQIGLIVCGAALFFLVMGGVMVTHISTPMFRSNIAIVEMDKDDKAEIAQLQQSAKPVLIPADIPDDATRSSDIPVRKSSLTGQAVTTIPTAVYAQKSIDETVDNILLMLDGQFYLLSYNKVQGRTLLVTINSAVLQPVYGYGWATLADSYELGGLPCVINTLNQSLELDIQKYIFVNSAGLWAVADRMGGLPLTLSKAEAAELNHLMGTAYTADENTMWTGGLQVYTQLTVDGDAIAHWQKACNTLIDKAKREKQLSQFMKAAGNNISTNLSASEFKFFSQQFLQNQSIERSAFPFTSTQMYLTNGTLVLDADLSANRQVLKRLLYPS